MELFREENYTVTISPELKTIEEFATIIKSDKHRHKTFSTKVFSYIYFMYDYRSPYIAYPEKTRHSEVLSSLRLTEFKITPKIQAAIDKYLELRQTPTIRLLRESRETLQTSVDMIKILRREIDTALSELSEFKRPTVANSDELTDEELADAQDAIMNYMKLKQAHIKNATDNLEKLLSLSDKIPKSISTLSELEDKVKAEEASSTRVKGGLELGAYED